MPQKNDTVIFRGHAVKIIRVTVINNIPHFYVPVPGCARSYAMVTLKDFRIA